MARRALVRGAALVGALALATTGLMPTVARDPLPPPSSTGTNIPLTYQGPPPSEVDKNLVGPVKLLRAGTVNQDAFTVTLPLYRGQLTNGKNVWYILTDTTDERNAEALGLNFSAKLNYAAIGMSVRNGWIREDGTLEFDRGAVDFSPERSVVPGDAPDYFPPASAQPGSVGNAEYTPLVKIRNAGDHIYNAPVVAFDVPAGRIDFCDGDPDYSLVHDRVVSICPDGKRGGTVTLQMTPIFSFAKPSAYISTEASDPVVAALDAGTFAPSLGDVPVGADDGAFSAVERLFPIANGPTGADNPQRQGLNSALSDVGKDGKPLPPVHVIGGLPTVALDYSPLWDLNLGEWTQEAIDKGYRSRLIDEFQLLEFVRQGWLTGPGGAKFGSTGIVVNCPIVMRFL
ncbi:MAG: hypothetical protein H0V04_07300 [Chloroflexi bacterium]|nr:hypothetical protein [Chloroflexota bacterium]